MSASPRHLPLRRIALSDTALLRLITAATVVLHMLTGG